MGLDNLLYTSWKFIFKQNCVATEHHPDIVLPAAGNDVINGRGSDTPTSCSSSDTEKEWKSAKTCFHRKNYPSSIPPPLGDLEEGKKRYPSSIPPPLGDLEEGRKRYPSSIPPPLGDLEEGRKRYPSSIPPPLGDLEEGRKRYGVNGVSRDTDTRDGGRGQEPPTERDDTPPVYGREPSSATSGGELGGVCG